MPSTTGGSGPTRQGGGGGVAAVRFITTEENTFSVPSLGQGEVAVGHAPMAT